MSHSNNILLDRFQRRINYLRLSVTDRCDFRCVYCMAEDMNFLPRSEVLSLEELYEVAKVFSTLGVSKIRLTGGEPLVRRDVLKLIEKLGQLPDLKQLALTTNGSQLQRMAAPLQQAGVTSINISLDSLQPARFKSLTRTGELKQVLAGIESAIKAGFKRIKLNAVMLKGRNADEALDLLRYARSLAIDIAFIEEMPLGQIVEHDRALSLCSSDELQQIINQEFPLSPEGEPGGSSGPARYYRMGKHPTRVGFISPHSNNFCHLCNRVRLTASGRLLLCLGNEHSVDLREVLRRPDYHSSMLKEAIIKAMQIKPLQHHFNEPEATEIVRFMNMTGG
ncbi:GTP 3',8-cyclase MoaA [Parahaliea sp. F7430]|uniref:GTP 3',8-cyclase n=1 Tax=Sediminihaliea albiluteola TaxID=2758564 RepID=A0A7W2TWJ1_9GAMM|nr:GTP 3',8-cyclase MoaA [Sediminihaliea albiluteola]MBA6413266.1 GTP 3',8-cyclase MoaA [Sediminihaliea albiluteola]